MKIKLLNTVFLLMIFTYGSIISYGQTSDPISKDSTKPTKICEPKDIRDLLRKKGKPPKPQKQTSLLILPNISSNPTNGFLIGVGGNLAVYFGPKESTRISFAGFSIAVTSKKQFLSFLKTNIYTKDNKLFLKGDLRYYHYRLPTYGLGTNSPPDSTDYDGGWIWQGADTKDTEGGYPMLYDNIRFHEVAYIKINSGFYGGIGYHLDYFWKIVDSKLKLDTLPKQITPHFVYSKVHGFNTDNYILSGLSVNFMYDSRDNLINPYKGYFANISYRINQTWLGSDQNASSLWLEFRTYIGLSKKMPRHLIAFWTFGNFQLTGERPYLTLMALGEDQRARSGRGYVGGRFRGEDYVYAEAEYRFPISQCSELIGGVIFVNMNTASNRDTNVALFQYVMPAAGFGVRIMFNKNTRLNLNLDFAVGIKTQGFYFSGTETF